MDETIGGVSAATSSRLLTVCPAATYPPMSQQGKIPVTVMGSQAKVKLDLETGVRADTARDRDHPHLPYWSRPRGLV